MLRPRQKLGKYKVIRKIAEGGFATIHEALDTVEGIRVALKVPHKRMVDAHALKDFRREVKLMSRLDHPNILKIKNADFIDGMFVICNPLGEGTLEERLRKRLTMVTVVEYARQMLAAVAYAHEHYIIHCDIKPGNLILFPDHRLRLTDFGISRIAMRTMVGSGSGTIGYLAPEQAMGKASFRSDVFSLGLTLYEMLAGKVPTWPFDWPPTGIERVQRKAHPDFVSLIERALRLDQYQRFDDAGRMFDAFEALRKRNRLVAPNARRRLRKASTAGRKDWKAIREKEFLRRWRKQLDVTHKCGRCDGPVSEAMHNCPWCGKGIKIWRGPTRFPERCTRCKRGRKLDWRFCGWCYGPGFKKVAEREYSDVRYAGKCSSERCTRRVLMPFQRYCSWCRAKVARKWPIEGSGKRCGSCGWGVVHEFWSHCPWCAKTLATTRRRGG